MGSILAERIIHNLFNILRAYPVKSRNFPFHPGSARDKPNTHRTSTVYLRSVNGAGASPTCVGERGSVA